MHDPASRLVYCSSFAVSVTVKEVVAIVQSVQHRQDDQGSIPGRGKRFFYSTASRPALGPTQPPVQSEIEAFSQRVKRPGHEADHSLPYSAEVNKRGSYTSTTPYVFMAYCLIT
jgi:hypothetical protein